MLGVHGKLAKKTEYRTPHNNKIRIPYAFVSINGSVSVHWQVSKKSLYTTLAVYLPCSALGKCASIWEGECATITSRPSGSPTQESATYSWPCENTGAGKNTQKGLPLAFIDGHGKSRADGELTPCECEGQL